MCAAASIVLYGRDPSLMETRRWVLQASGHQVDVLLESAGVQQRLAGPPVHLLILCHSLSSSEAGFAVNATRKLQPQARILSLVAADVATDLNLPIAVTSSRNGPADLIVSVAKLLSRPAT